MSGSTIGLDSSTYLPSNIKSEEVNLQPFRSQERQARALERIADTLDRMLAVMLDEGEPEAADPLATLDASGITDDDWQRNDSGEGLPWNEEHPHL